MIDYYLETEQMPHMWCSGCGNGIVMGSLLRTAQGCGFTLENTVIVSGIGCSSRIAGYMKFNSLHTAHGRALPFATGVKMARPDLNVVVISGDGDAVAIGGNHFIHACRRNIDLTLIIINNHTYGMTKGQYSPLTPLGARSATTVYGNVDRPFDIPDLACAAGASYVARASVYHVSLLDQYIKAGIHNKGFSVIECLSICPTHYGRRNGMTGAVQMMADLRDNGVMAKCSDSQHNKQNVYALGEYRNRPSPEYTGQYAKIIQQARMGSL